VNSAVLATFGDSASSTSRPPCSAPCIRRACPARPGRRGASPPPDRQRPRGSRTRCARVRRRLPRSPRSRRRPRRRDGR
jgi:hypothetical protein